MKKTILAAAVAAAGLMSVAVPATAAGVGVYVGTPGYYNYDNYDRDRYDADRDRYNRDDRYWRSGYNRYHARVCNHWQWQDHPGYCRRLMWRMHNNY